MKIYNEGIKTQTILLNKIEVELIIKLIQDNVNSIDECKLFDKLETYLK